MIAQYSDYAGCLKELPFEDCVRIHGMMAEEIGNDETALDLYADLLEAALDYVRIRAEWTIRPQSWKMEADARRTSYHDSVISNVNYLARCLRQQGKPAAWRDELGDPEADKGYRKRIGDFACFLAYIHGINGR